VPQPKDEGTTWIFAELMHMEFDASLLAGLSKDPLLDDAPRDVAPGALYSRVHERDPFNGRRRAFVAFNSAVAEHTLGWSTAATGTAPEGRGRPAWLLSGAETPPGAVLVAHRYAGHQGGAFVEQLGDGDAISWGSIRPRNARLPHTAMEVESGSSGVTGYEEWLQEYAHAYSSSGSLEFSLRGTGVTPYSKETDGLLGLREGVKEFLGSAALAGLQIPTTVALSLVVDEEHRHGSPEEEAPAVVARLAPSWLRFGTVELLYKEGKLRELQVLLDTTIAVHFSHLITETDREVEERTGRLGNAGLYERLLGEIVTRTGRLVAHWMANGFCHGKLDTDSMSLLGITMDLGHFGFMEAYDKDWICNPNDSTGRYKFGDQPSIAMWNLKKMSDAFVPYIKTKGQLASLKLFFPEFGAHFLSMMRAKLGLGTTAHSSNTDAESVNMLLELLGNCHVDYHLFFRELTKAALEEGIELPDRIRGLFAACADEEYTIESNMSLMEAWFMLYKKRFHQEETSPVFRVREMAELNPRHVLRPAAIDALAQKAHQHDCSSFKAALQLLGEPCKAAPASGCELARLFRSSE